ncbi:transposase [Methylocaldum sp.]|uniref:transposase n=1 Tax=Methylocaldum sp. TaxID=1969727 RepID=UPI002D4C84A3|nr:transposase [Methylocaldum sp.]HYE36860.1 transposase [Methylocaldum sp.]
MAKLPRQSFTTEFREQAVRLITEDKLSVPEAARRLSLSAKTLANWVYKARAGQLGEVGKSRQPVSDLEAEISRLKRELAEAKLERDLLKKAAAYFASESMRGTRS